MDHVYKGQICGWKSQCVRPNSANLEWILLHGVEAKFLGGYHPLSGGYHPPSSGNTRLTTLF